MQCSKLLDCRMKTANLVLLRSERDRETAQSRQSSFVMALCIGKNIANREAEEKTIIIIK